jgi:DNA-binding transcriptional MocR family regulator
VSRRQTGTLFWLPVILDCEDLDPTETLLLVAMADHIDADDQCWPGIDTLAAAARVSYPTASRRLKALVDRGFITRERRHSQHGHLSSYTYTFVREAFGLVIKSITGPARKTDPPSAHPDGDWSSDHPGARGTTQSLEPRKQNRPTPANNAANNDAVRKAARRVVDDWWEARKAAGVSPAQPYIAVVKIVDTALRNGVSVNDLTAALRDTPTVTGASLEFTLSKLRGRVGRAAPNVSSAAAEQIVADYAETNGSPRNRPGSPLPLPP